MVINSQSLTGLSPKVASALEAWLLRSWPLIREQWPIFLQTKPAHAPVPEADQWLMILRAGLFGHDLSVAWPKLWPQSEPSLVSSSIARRQIAGLLQFTFSCMLETAPSDPGPVLWKALVSLQNRLLADVPAQLDSAQPVAEPGSGRPDEDGGGRPSPPGPAGEYRGLSQRFTEVSTIYALANRLTQSLDLDEVLNAVVVSLRQLIGCRGCCIFLLDEANQVLEIKAAAGLQPKWREAAKLRVGEGAAGKAVATGATIYIPDTHQDPSFIFFDESVRSLLVVPLQTKNRVIGALNLDDRRPNAFGPDQERLLSIAAAQAAIAIENAALFSRVLSEQQLTRAIIQHIADGLLMIDRQGQIARCNPALARMLGMRSVEIVGQNIYAPDLDDRLLAICAPATQPERTGVLAHEVQLDRPSPRILRIFVTVMKNEAGDPLGEVRVVHDVTQERELDQLKDEFVANVSHELRTPLFSIQGFLRLMLDNEDLDTITRREFMTIIERQTNNLTKMVTNLLDLARLADGHLAMASQPVQMLDIIKQTVLQMQGYARQQHVVLITELPPELPQILGDAQRLEQVTTNLLGNAIKFTPAGGTVVIKARLKEEILVITVVDTGIGIPLDKLPYLFARFYRVEEHSDYSSGGSGLGLHISKQIVEGHGGKIWAESRKGVGSKFSFSLPLPS